MTYSSWQPKSMEHSVYGKKLYELHRPRIMLFDKFADEHECDSLIEFARINLQPARIIDSETGISREDPTRIAEVANIETSESLLLDNIDKRLSEFIQWAPQFSERVQLTHYKVGGNYKPHFDFYQDQDSKTFNSTDRVATAILYLNNVAEGGSTFFPNLGIDVSPMKGNAICFFYDDGDKNQLTLHGGQPVIRGEKWIAVKWFHRGGMPQE